MEWAKKTLAMGVVLLIVSCGAAAEQQAKEAKFETVEDYLRYAALHNAGLKSSFEQWQSALAEAVQAGTLVDPKITYGYYIEEVETRVGPQRQKFGISQTFPWFGKLEARSSAAAAAAEAAKQRYEAEKLKLFHKVKHAFYGYAYLGRATRIAGDNLELLKHFERVARTKYTAAAAGHPDMIRAQLELAQIEDVLKSLEELRAPTVAELNATLNRPSNAELPWPKEAEFKVIQLSREMVTEILRKRNPELAGLELELEAARYRVELAKKQFFPDIGVGVDWIQTERDLTSGVDDSGKDPVILMFSMNLPIWQESYRAGEQQARAEARRIEQQRIETENSIVAKAAAVLYDYEDSARKIKLYRDTLIPKADELLSASETAYKAGKLDFLSLVDAQRMLLGYQLSYERSLAENRQAFAELEMLVGVELDRVE